MARKETPDVLGELLAGPAGDAEITARPAAAPPVKKARAPRSRSGSKSAAPLPTTPTRWDHLIISFADYRGWRPRYINGQEIRNWMEAPLIHDYLAQLAEDGWELVGAGGGKALYGSGDFYQLFLKREKK